jgi:uncharacterized damage-inducible protein DinB
MRSVRSGAGWTGGARRGPALVASDYPTAASLIERWKHVEGSVREFLGNLRDEDLDRVVEFTLGNGPRCAMRLEDLMHHGAIHGVHHRGQVALLLRALGYVPGNIDILLYYRRA